MSDTIPERHGRDLLLRAAKIDGHDVASLDALRDAARQAGIDGVAFDQAVSEYRRNEEAARRRRKWRRGIIAYGILALIFLAPVVLFVIVRALRAP